MTPWSPKTHHQDVKEQQRRGGLTPTPRGTTTERGYGYRWQKIRKLVLARDPCCKICERQGRLAVSTDVDHITPKSKGGTDDMGNLQGACHSCHSRKTATEDGGFGNV